MVLELGNLDIINTDLNYFYLNKAIIVLLSCMYRIYNNIILYKNTIFLFNMQSFNN